MILLSLSRIKSEKSDDDVSISGSVHEPQISSNCSIPNLCNLETISTGKVEPEMNGKSPEKSKMYFNQGYLFCSEHSLKTSIKISCGI